MTFDEAAEKKQLTLQEFYALLERHDWYYDWSDDHRVWRKGTRERNILESLAKENGPEYQTLLEQYRKYMFKANTEQISKPARPEDNG